MPWRGNFGSGIARDYDSETNVTEKLISYMYEQTRLMKQFKRKAPINMLQYFIANKKSRFCLHIPTLNRINKQVHKS